ncbi:MAG TPA: 30S ribosomal protein S16 [Candidatus Saccharimonadales bacterium]|nr:30S ribosomal protein S16 [Candidatus Saccharimonadales bacterium]
MLAIRLKRTGRTGHAQFRVVVQDSRFHPTRGRIVAYLGSYNPHSKATQLDKDLVAKYLGNGAQPSDRVARLLKSEGVKLPDWVKTSDPKERAIRNPEKLRRNQPKEESAPEVEATAEASQAAEEPAPTEEASAEPEAEAAQPEAPSPEADVPADGETTAEQ